MERTGIEPTESYQFHSAFAIVADRNTRLLVLGSLPGRQSLDARRYYANPRNQFWALMSPVAGVDLVPLAYPDRLAALLAAGVGLWDVVASARRRGSLDTAIRDVRANDLHSAVASLPHLRALAFNGAKAFQIGQRQLGPSPTVTLIPLPSSSSAHAVGLATKQNSWNQLTLYRS